MLLTLALFFVPGIARAQTSDEGFDHWKFDQCRAFVGQIDVTQGAAKVEPPKPQPRPNESAAVRSEKTNAGAGRRVIFVANGQRHALDQASPSRRQGEVAAWEQYEPASGDWIVYEESGDALTVTIQRKQERGGKIGGVATDVVTVLKYSSDGQYVEQAFAKNASGDIVYQNGTACGKAFGEETSIALAPAGPKTSALKFDFGTY